MQLEGKGIEVRKSSRPHVPKKIGDDFEATIPVMNRRNQ